MTKPLKDMIALATMKYDLCAHELAHLNATIAELEDQISELRHQIRSSCSFDPKADLSLSFGATVAERWQIWCNRQIVTLNQQLSIARAQREDLQTAAREAFARKSASEALLTQFNRTQKAARGKRALNAIIQAEISEESTFIQRASGL